MELLLAHDVGTSGCKAALVAVDGRILATAYHPYPTHYPHLLYAEQDPLDWWEAVKITTRQVMEFTSARPEEILGLSFSTQMVNAIPLNAQGAPLTPCISWLDGRAGEEAIYLMRKVGGPQVFAMIAGVAITGKDVLPKHLWIKRRQPEIYRQCAAIVDASSYLLYRTTGRLVYDWTTASVTGLFNLKTKNWDNTLIRFFGLDPSKYPPLVLPVEQVGGLIASAAADLGLLAGTPVFGGAGDAQTAAVGSGAMGDGDGHICLGTSGFAGIVTRRHVVGKRGIACIQSADPTKLLLVAETETAGACLKWAARELFASDPDEGTLKRMDEEVDAAQPDAGGLLFTPWMYGERSPICDERVRAAFINLGANHSRADMARAIYEGVAYNLRWMLESQSELYGFHPNPVRVLGGGAKGHPWVQIIADITGRTLEAVSHPQECSALGAALIAAVGLGIYPSFEAIKAIIPVSYTSTPRTLHSAIYDRQYAAFREIYASLRKVYHRLNQ